MKRFLLIAALLASTSANASTTFGEPSCGEWIKDPNPTRKTWLLGFLSGFNMMWGAAGKSDTDDPLAEINSAPQIYAWVDTYCRQNPSKSVVNAADGLFAELIERQQAKKK